MSSYREHIEEFQQHFRGQPVDGDFIEFAAAYKCGANLRAEDPRASWLEVRPRARRRWKSLNSDKNWQQVEEMICFAFNCTKERVRDGSQGITG